MRSQSEARNDALEHSAELIDALQDMDAPPHLISEAEDVHNEVEYTVRE